MAAVDARGPRATSARSGRVYQPGIGPFSEDKAVDLTVAEVEHLFPGRYTLIRTRVPYPGSRQRCDLVLGEPPVWAIEVKMARFSGDNGKPDDTSIKDLLSPFDCDRSALTDCQKLVASRIAPRCALLLYGFDDLKRPLDVAVQALEDLAAQRVSLGTRICAPFTGLVHPVFQSGRVCGWEIQSKSDL